MSETGKQAPNVIGTWVGQTVNLHLKLIQHLYPTLIHPSDQAIFN